MLEDLFDVNSSLDASGFYFREAVLCQNMRPVLAPLYCMFDVFVFSPKKPGLC